MLSIFRKRSRPGYIFTKIYFGEDSISGRCTYGNTKQDVYDYYKQDAVIMISRAYMCIHKDHPTIKAFGRTKSEAYTKLERVIDYVKSCH